jgi:hypothetical protein
MMTLMRLLAPVVLLAACGDSDTATTTTTDPDLGLVAGLDPAPAIDPDDVRAAVHDFANADVDPDDVFDHLVEQCELAEQFGGALGIATVWEDSRLKEAMQTACPAHHDYVVEVADI